MRPQVQVSMIDRFVDDTTAATATHAGFTSGISSALSGDLLTDSNARSFPVLPAYPNGVGRTSSFTAPSTFIRNAIPIRKLGDGMSDGLGRIKREISSSYHYYHHRRTSEEDSAEDDSVPLEFGEDEEDFWKPEQENQELDKFDDISVVGLLDEEQQVARTLRNKSR